MILLIVLTIFLLADVGLFISILIAGFYPYIVIPIIFGIISFIFWYFWLYRYCKKYVTNNVAVKDIRKFICTNSSRNGIISFVKENGFYVCKCNGDIIKFNLTGFIFKKEFIRAYVIRQLRYNAISNKLKVSKLFCHKLKCKTNFNTVWLIIDKKKYLILDSNGITYNSFISSEISKSMFSNMYINQRMFRSLDNVIVINEEIYLNYCKPKQPLK